MESEQNSNKKIKTISLIATISIVGLWILTYFLLKDKTNAGILGDMFGSINALFSGLALAGIIITILLQRNELSLQREELKETRKEFTTQNETLKLQRFENTFFNLLTLHHQIVENLELKTIHKRNNVVVDNKELKGRQVVDKVFQNFSESLAFNPNKYYVFYEKIDDQYSYLTGHYFRNLYQIIKLVDNTKFSDDEIIDYKEKYKYTSIVRAQLSDREIGLLFYNCLYKKGIENFKPLIEKYTLFKNIREQLVIDEQKTLYKNSAFEKIIL